MSLTAQEIQDCKALVTSIWGASVAANLDYNEEVVEVVRITVEQISICSQRLADFFSALVIVVGGVAAAVYSRMWLVKGAKRIADEIQNYPQNVRGGASTLTGGYDRRHRATLRAVADIPYDFSVGLTSSFESGFLYESLFRDDQRDRSLSTGPANFQADLRLEKRISFADRYGVDLYVDLVNLTNRHNVIAFNRNELSEEALAFETTGNPGKRLVQRDGSVLYGPARSVYFGARVRF